MRKNVINCVAAALLLLPAGALGASKVILGQIDISFYAVTGQVVQTVLERLGHEVELKTGSHSQIFPQLGAGQVDLLVAAWLPSAHRVYWDKHGANSSELATLYRGARLYWAVPDYIPAAEVSRVEDLRKPEVNSKMVKTIRGTGPDSGLMIGSRKIMESYGLERDGYKLLPGKHEEWHRHFEENYAARRWFVMPYFRPNYLNRIAELRMIEERFEFLGGENNGVLVAHNSFVASAPPKTIKVLSRLELGLDAVAEMDYMVRVGAMNPRDAARAWIQSNQKRVEGWFSE